MLKLQRNIAAFCHFKTIGVSIWGLWRRILEHFKNHYVNSEIKSKLRFQQLQRVTQAKWNPKTKSHDCRGDRQWTFTLRRERKGVFDDQHRGIFVLLPASELLLCWMTAHARILQLAESTQSQNGTQLGCSESSVVIFCRCFLCER